LIACRGRHGQIVYPGKRWIDLDEFLDSKPILEDVPVNRLFGRPDDCQPYMSNDASYRLIKLGLYLPYFRNILGKSCSGAFSKGNVGVIADLGMFAYRNLEEEADHKWKSNSAVGYNEFSIFMRGIISERHPSSHNMLPKGLDAFFSLLDGNEVKPEFALDYPCLLSDEKYGSMLIQVSRLLRNEFRVFGKSAKPIAILRQIPLSEPDCVAVCQKHPVLNEYLPSSLKNVQFHLDDLADNVTCGPETVRPRGPGSIFGLVSSSIKTGTGGPGMAISPPMPVPVGSDLPLAVGIILVDVNRHGSIHSVESKLLPLIDFLPGSCASNLRHAPYTRKEVIQLLRYNFPLYLPVAFEAFWVKGEWDTLGARLADPIPSIYSAPGCC
jgi:hypothetical protein